MDYLLQGDLENAPALLHGAFSTNDESPTWTIVRHKEDFTLYKDGWLPYTVRPIYPTIKYTKPIK